MSTESEENGSQEEPGALRSAYRSVTPSVGFRVDSEMDVVGWLIFLGLVILIVPLLPIITIVWLISRAIGFVSRQRGA